MQNTYIKLAIGLVLFITWVALVVFKVPGTDDIIGVIKLALAGLGVYHIKDVATAAPAPAPDRQAGFALPGFLLVLALGAALLLGGCAAPAPGGTPVQQTQVTYTQACAAYGAAFGVALELRRGGKLNRAQIDQVTLLDNQVTPICTGQLPADPATATQQITAAVTALTILEVAKKVN